MICPATRNMLAIVAFLLCINFCSAQNNASPEKEDEIAVKQNASPFKVLTSGKQITIKSSKNIKTIMVWTASGHRIVEQKELNASSYNFRITVNEKIFFLMLQLVDGKIYSEKIGIR
jgi:hypothetical protein